ncbi:MAG TPA: methyltransferase domain-containing protein [Polyangiaceae bacterium]
MKLPWIAGWLAPVGLLVITCAAACRRTSAPETQQPPTARAASSQRAPGPETPDADPHPTHDAGPSGYHMDFSHTQHFAAHFDDAGRDAWQKPKHVLELLAIQPGARVVDLGAGTGYFVSVLSRAVGESGRVLAVDTERKMIEHLMKRSAEKRWRNVEARLVPADDPKLEADSWDRILIVNTWHHIDDRAAYTRKLARGLKPDGILLIVDFTRESDIGPPLHHRLTADEVHAELRAGGLAARIRDENLPKQYVVSGTRVR